MSEQPIQPPQDNPDRLKQRPIREIVLGGIGFIIFLSVMVVGINAVGVESLQQFIQDAGPWAPLAYITLKAITYIFAPLTSGPIQVIAGTLFGNLWLGVLYTLIGEVIGGSVSFLIARRFGRPMISRFVGPAGMNQIDEFYKKRMGGWVSLVLTRIVLFSVWDFLSYAAGLAESVRFRTYVFVSIFAGAIPTLFFVWIGTQAFEDPRSLFFIYGLVAVLILIPILARKQIERLLDWASGQDKAKRGS
ncbi:MAG: VTT domain-containing protein [Phototrophicaceae bacterium]